jgi:hypothetical protein
VSIGESGFDTFDHVLGHEEESKSETVIEWKEGGPRFWANGLKGSSSSSSSGGWRALFLREEVERERAGWSGSRGAAMARLELVLKELGAQTSGEGVSPLRLARDAGFEDAAERGRGIGLNSEAFAFKN